MVLTSEQPRIATKALGHSFVRSLVRSLMSELMGKEMI